MKESDRPDSKAALDARSASDITQFLTPIEPAVDRAALLKSRVLHGARDSRHQSDSEVPSRGLAQAANLLTISAAQREWSRFIPGVDICVLYEDEAHRTALFRMQAGSVLPAHHHEMSEESMVLEGSALIGDDIRVEAGDYQFAAAGSQHPVISSPSGCVVLVRGERRPRAQVNAGLLTRLVSYFGQSARRLRQDAASKLQEPHTYALPATRLARIAPSCIQAPASKTYR